MNENEEVENEEVQGLKRGFSSTAPKQTEGTEGHAASTNRIESDDDDSPGPRNPG